MPFLEAQPRAGSSELASGLPEINEAYAALGRGEVARTVVTF